MGTTAIEKWHPKQEVAEESERIASQRVAERSDGTGEVLESEAKEQIIHPQTGKILPYLSSEDGSIVWIETTRETRHKSAVILSSADKAEGDEVDQMSEQVSNEMDTQAAKTPEVDMLSPGAEPS